MTDKEIIQKVLDALDLLAWCENPATRVQVRKPKGSGSIVTVYPHKVATDAAALLREWMAQPEQEPVAWLYESVCGKDFATRCDPPSYAKNIRPLYTSPPKREWHGLTDVDVSKILDEQIGFYTFEKCFNFAKAIEFKIKEKNT